MKVKEAAGAPAWSFRAHAAAGAACGAITGAAVGLLMVIILKTTAPYYADDWHRTALIPAYLVAYSSALFGITGLALGIAGGAIAAVIPSVRAVRPRRLYRSAAIAGAAGWVGSQYITWRLFRGQMDAGVISANAGVAAAALAVWVLVYRLWSQGDDGGRTRAHLIVRRVAWLTYSVCVILAVGAVWTNDPRSGLAPDRLPSFASSRVPAAPSSGDGPLAPVGILPPLARAGGATPRAAERPGAAASPPEARIIVLLTIDTLRADRLGCYGYTRPTSPEIDAFAAESLRFERMYALSSGTVPSACSILTGADPILVGATNQSSALPDGVETVAESLRRAGYRTRAALCQGLLIPESGFAQGFDEYVNIPVTDKNTDRVVRAAFEQLEGARSGEKCFFWFHLLTPHDPYNPPRADFELFRPDTRRLQAAERRPLYEYSARHGVTRNRLGADYQDELPPDEVSMAFVNALYDAQVRATSRFVGRILDRIREMGLWDETAIVLSADHGEAMGERDIYCRHCVSINEPLVRVPLLVRWPGMKRAGQTSHRKVMSSDIAPTLLAMAGAPPGRAMTGKSLAGFMMESPASWAPRSVIVQTTWAMGVDMLLNSRRYDYPDWGIIDGEYKYILHANTVFDEMRTPLNYVLAWRKLVCGGVLRDELYRLDDLGRNRIDEEPARAAELRARLLASPQLAAFRRQERGGMTSGEEALERLRSLGYLGN